MVRLTSARIKPKITGMPTRSASGAAHPRPRVLLIDDSATVLALYTLMLEQEVDVQATTRGEEGYQLACADRPDAIIVDVIMPDINGLDLCQRVLANPTTASVPLIVLTGDDQAFAHASAMHGLDAVLRKPCTMDTLLNSVRRAIASRAVR